MERKTSKAEGAAARLALHLVTFDEAARSLRACGFEVFVELAFD
jgi:hypothetical protein